MRAAVDVVDTGPGGVFVVLTSDSLSLLSCLTEYRVGMDPS